MHHNAGHHVISITACDIKFKRSILNLCSVNGLMSDSYRDIDIFSSALLQHLTVKGETKMRYTGTYNMFMLNIFVHMQDNDCGNFPYSSSYSTDN